MTITNDKGKLELSVRLSIDFIKWTSIVKHFKIV